MKKNILTHMCFTTTVILCLNMGQWALAQPNQRLEQGQIQQMNQMGSQNHKRPPREALEACKDKATGDSCRFSGRDQTQLTGTCFAPKEDLPLACRPNQDDKKMGQKQI